ncbi:Hypothetical protein FKW44_004709, partial [Caligus rogercresseyi]
HNPVCTAMYLNNSIAYNHLKCTPDLEEFLFLLFGYYHQKGRRKWITKELYSKT